MTGETTLSVVDQREVDFYGDDIPAESPAGEITGASSWTIPATCF